MGRMQTIPSFQILINERAIEVCRILQNAGYQAYIVGGCVRDLHLNEIPKDWDICTDATPEQVMHIIPRYTSHWTTARNRHSLYG